MDYVLVTVISGKFALGNAHLSRSPKRLSIVYMYDLNYLA